MTKSKLNMVFLIQSQTPFMKSSAVSNNSQKYWQLQHLVIKITKFRKLTPIIHDLTNFLWT